MSGLTIDQLKQDLAKHAAEAARIRQHIVNLQSELSKENGIIAYIQECMEAAKSKSILLPVSQIKPAKSSQSDTISAMIAPVNQPVSSVTEFLERVQRVHKSASPETWATLRPSQAAVAVHTTPRTPSPVGFSRKSLLDVIEAIFDETDRPLHRSEIAQLALDGGYDQGDTDPYVLTRNISTLISREHDRFRKIGNGIYMRIKKRERKGDV